MTDRRKMTDRDAAWQPLYQDQLQAVQDTVIMAQRRVESLAAELRAKGFEVEFTDGSVIVRMPPEVSGDEQERP